MDLLAPRIRRATRADDRALAALSEETYVETFVEGFSIPYAPADLEAFLEQAHTRAAFLKMFADPARKLWIAEGPGEHLQGVRAVGYAVAGPCRLPHPDTAAGDPEISRLYVRSEAQGAGLAQRLMEAVMAAIDPKGARTVWLGVWSGNERAQRFYARYGFEIVGEYDYPVGATVDRDLIMRRTPRGG